MVFATRSEPTSELCALRRRRAERARDGAVELLLRLEDDAHESARVQKAQHLLLQRCVLRTPQKRVSELAVLVLGVMVVSLLGFFQNDVLNT